MATRRKKLKKKLKQAEQRAEDNALQAGQYYQDIVNERPSSYALMGLGNVQAAGGSVDDYLNNARASVGEAPTDPTDAVRAEINHFYSFQPQKYRDALIAKDPRIVAYQRAKADYDQRLQQAESDARRAYQRDLTQAGEAAFTERFQSNLANVNAVDPQLAAAQRQGLEQMQGALPYFQQVAQQGFTPEDQAALDASMRQANLNERAQRDAVMQSFRARGMGGSGMALAGALSAQQGEANRSADMAAQLGMAALDRRYGANQDLASLAGQTAGLAGQMDAQRYGQEMGRGTALDQFNMQLAGLRSGAEQQSWQNRFGLAGAQSGAANNLSGFYSNQAQQAQQQLQNMNQMAMQGANMAIQAAGSAFGARKTGTQQGDWLSNVGPARHTARNQTGGQPSWGFSRNRTPGGT